MKPIQIALLGGGAYILYQLMNKQAAGGRLNFYPASVKGLSFDGVTPVLTFGLAVQNSSNSHFTLNSMTGNLFANKYLIGNVSFFTPQYIGPNSQVILNIKVRLSLIGIVTNIVKQIQQHTFNEVLELESFINVDGFQVPVNIDYKIG